MIFYYKSNNDFNIQVKNLLKNIDEQINIQTIKKKALSNCLESLNVILLNNLSDIETSLKLSTLLQNINDANKIVVQNISDLEKLKLFLTNSTSDSPNKFNSKNKKLLNIVKQYNKLAIACKNSIHDSSMLVEQILIEYTESFKSTISNYISIVSQNTNSNPISEFKSKEENIDNKTLLISEIQNKVVLPYTISDLENILANNSNYHTLQDVIDSEYTIPLSEYKNPSLSRFKETFNLMRKKEKSSIADSLNLALELSFNTLLNPAIIAACKNLDELDIYLDCLTSNELDKFKFFQIKYEILPKIVRKKI